MEAALGLGLFLVMFTAIGYGLGKLYEKANKFFRFLGFVFLIPVTLAIIGSFNRIKVNEAIMLVCVVLGFLVSLDFHIKIKDFLIKIFSGIFRLLKSIFLFPFKLLAFFVTRIRIPSFTFPEFPKFEKKQKSFFENQREEKVRQQEEELKRKQEAFKRQQKEAEEELRRFRQQQQGQAYEETKQNTAQMPKTLEEAFEVLGTRPRLSMEEYKRIYKQEAMKYHPDKTRGLGERLQRQAEEEMKRINKAWEIIRCNKP